jgi:hypothetical protein
MYILVAFVMLPSALVSTMSWMGVWSFQCFESALDRLLLRPGNNKQQLCRKMKEGDARSMRTARCNAGKRDDGAVL